MTFRVYLQGFRIKLVEVSWFGVQSSEPRVNVLWFMV